jgi:hypothetical protein
MILFYGPDRSFCHALEKLNDQFSGSKGKPVVKLAGSFFSSQRHFILEEDRTRIHAFIHFHDAQPGSGFIVENGTLYGSRPAVSGEKGSMDIHTAPAGYAKKPALEDLSEGDNDNEIGIFFLDEIAEVLI